MLQLVYTSTVARDWDGDLHSLAKTAAACNVDNEITGILLSRRGVFLQVLEGPQLPVEDTFIRIIKDARHHSLRILSRRMLTAREFGDWAMAELDTDEEEREAIALVGTIMKYADSNAKAAFNERFGDVTVVSQNAPGRPEQVAQRNRFASQGPWSVARQTNSARSEQR